MSTSQKSGELGKIGQEALVASVMILALGGLAIDQAVGRPAHEITAEAFASKAKAAVEKQMANSKALDVRFGEQYLGEAPQITSVQHRSGGRGIWGELTRSTDNFTYGNSFLSGSKWDIRSHTTTGSVAHPDLLRKGYWVPAVPGTDSPAQAVLHETAANAFSVDPVGGGQSLKFTVTESGQVLPDKATAEIIRQLPGAELRGVPVTEYHQPGLLDGDRGTVEVLGYVGDSIVPKNVAH